MSCAFTIHRDGFSFEAVMLSKAACNDEWKQLPRNSATELQPTLAMADQLEDVTFPVHDNYHQVL